MKRDIDKEAHIYAPLFSPNFMKMYNAFMAQCFATDRGAGLDAQLRSDCVHYRDAYVGHDDVGSWQAEWDACFTGADEAVDKKEVFNAYQNLVKDLANELGVGLESDKS